MGVTIPFEKRKKIYELACKYDFLIYEDDPYGELRYTGEPVPSFKSIDTEGRVVYAGSFSKILCSGIRLGFICASNEMIAKMTALKGNLDSGSPVSSSLIARYFMEEDVYKRQVWDKNMCTAVTEFKEEENTHDETIFSAPSGDAHAFGHGIGLLHRRERRGVKRRRRK